MGSQLCEDEDHVYIALKRGPWEPKITNKLRKKYPAWNQRVHYNVHQSPSLAPILSQINPIHTLPFHFFNIHLNIIIPCICCLSDIFPSGFLTKISYAFLIPFMSEGTPLSPHNPSCDHAVWSTVKIRKAPQNAFFSSLLSPPM